MYSDINGNILFNLRRGNHKYVYSYLDPRTPSLGEFPYTPYYIGCGSNDRVRKHLKQSEKEHPDFHKVNPEVVHKTQDILEEGLFPIIVILFEGEKENALKVESYYIDKYGKEVNETGVLFNRYSTKEARIKGKSVIREKSRITMSAAALRKFKEAPMSLETRQRMSISRIGNTSLSTPEAKRNRFMTMVIDTLEEVKRRRLPLTPEMYNACRPSPKHIRFQSIRKYLSVDDYCEAFLRMGFSVTH